MDQVEIRRNLVAFFMDWLRDHSIFEDADVITHSELFMILRKVVSKSEPSSESVYAQRDCLIWVQRGMASELADIVASQRMDLLDLPDEEEAVLRKILGGGGYGRESDVLLQ